MKKFILLLISILFLCGCASENNKDLSNTEKEEKLLKELDKLSVKHSTICSLSMYNIKDDPDGIVEGYFNYFVKYDDLTDKKFISSVYMTLSFNNYNNALAYEKKHKKEYEKWKTEIEEDIDNHIGKISYSNDFDYFELKYDGTVRDYIHKLQNDGYECETSDIGD